MKVNTDGILLGAWADVADTDRVLDVGTGTGLIALMMAQRSNAWIDAVEIDAAAFKEARTNFIKSPWADRLAVYHTTFQAFAEDHLETYDLIVSNPPFFNNSLLSPSDRKTLARHSISLQYSSLLEIGKRLLTPDGIICTIIPVSREKEIERLAKKNKLYIAQRLFVLSNTNGDAIRTIYAFSPSPHEPLDDIVIINGDEPNTYHESFKNLTSPFYLQF